MQNLEELKTKFGDAFCGSEDLVKRSYTAGAKSFVLFFIDGLVDRVQLDKSVLAPLLKSGGKFSSDIKGLDGVIPATIAIKVVENFDEAVSTVALGDAVLVFEDSDEFFKLPVRKIESRSVSEPPTSAVLKGPREGFTENIKTNIVLLRHHLATPKLVFRSFEIGRYSKTTVMLGFIDGVANPKVVKEVERRIGTIDIDGVLDASYVGKFLETRPYSIFKQIGSQEKPDIIAAKILEGRVAVFVDGSPIVLTVPFLLMEDFQSSEDYYKNTSRTSMLRGIRLLALFFALLLPATVVALLQHQFQMLPLKLLMTVLSSVEGIPFTPLIEMMIALILFEILNEASIRMPRYVGMAMSVVGAIVLGETAVKAGILSSVSVLVTALSAIGLYAIPDEVGAFSILRMLYVLVAGALGLFGIVIAGMATAVYLLKFDSYGVPYIAPLAPIVPSDLKDAMIMANLKDMKIRPKVLGSPNKRRQK